MFLTPDISQAPFPTYESEKRGNGYLFSTVNKVNHSPAWALPLLTYLSYSMKNVVLTMLLYAFHFHKVFRSAKGFVAVPTKSQNNGIALGNPKCKSFILTAKHWQILTTIVASYFKVKNKTKNPTMCEV